MDFSDLKTAIFDSKEYYVDSRKYKAYWEDKWVVYCDLIGFADACLRSNDTTFNLTVRFHRAIDRAKNSSPEVALYQFTDACFCISENPFSALKFAMELANCCLAHNAVLAETRATVFFHQLIVPRITMASGQVISLKGDSDIQGLMGIDVRSFLAGSAIVNAYKLEGKTFAGAIAIGADDLELLKARCSIRGEATGIRRALVRWKNETPDKDKKGGSCIEIPWPLINRVTDTGEIWAESTRSAKMKLLQIAEVSDKMTADFVIGGNPISMGKHQVGLQRFMFETICRIHRQRRFDIKKFRDIRYFMDLTWPLD